MNPTNYFIDFLMINVKPMYQILDNI